MPVCTPQRSRPYGSSRSRGLLDDASENQAERPMGDLMGGNVRARRTRTVTYALFCACCRFSPALGRAANEASPPREDLPRLPTRPFKAWSMRRAYPGKVDLTPHQYQGCADTGG